MFTWWLKRIFFYAIPPALLLYGADKIDGKIFGHPQHDAAHELAGYVIGMFITYIVVPASTEKTKKKFEEQEKLINALLGSLREGLNTELEHQFNVQNLNLNIRIFAPKKSFILWLDKKLWGKRSFVLTTHPELCVDSINGLLFQVTPNPEGVVGKVFENKCMLYASELNAQVSTESYNLNPHQISLLSDTKFVVALPVFKEGSRDEISAIISFDTKKSITLPANNDWEKAIRETHVIIKRCIPFICKSN